MGMETRNGKRSPGRGNGRRSSERQGRRCRTRSPRRRNSGYSPSRRRTRSRSLSPYRSRDSYHRGQRSSSSERKRRGNDDVRRPQYRGPENSKVLEKAERDRTRIIVYQNENASYDSKFDTKRLTSRERNRVAVNGNGRRVGNDRRLAHGGHSRNGWRDRRTTSIRSKYSGRRAYDRSSTSRDRSPSPLRRNHESRRNSDGKNYGRDYEDRHYYDKLERSRGTAKEQRLNASRRRGSRDHRASAYEKYDDKKTTYKRGKDSRHDGDNYSKNKEQVSENNDVENIDGSDASNENEEGGQSSSSDSVLLQPFPPPNVYPMPIVRPPLNYMGIVPYGLPYRVRQPLPPFPRCIPPYGMIGPPIPPRPMILRPFPPRPPYFGRIPM